MSKRIPGPTEIRAAGSKPKLIEEFIGLENTGTEDVSVARMNSPEGWVEPGQAPEFDEYTLVLRGTLCVRTADEEYEIGSGEAFIACRGEWVQYSTPYPDGAEYVAVCIPAFSPGQVHRDLQ
jgi:quercetin dioxygenase-like cupin family protein